MDNVHNGEYAHTFHISLAFSFCTSPPSKIKQYVYKVVWFDRWYCTWNVAVRGRRCVGNRQRSMIPDTLLETGAASSKKTIYEIPVMIRPVTAVPRSK